MNDTALIQLDTARHALAECKTAMEAKQIADVAEAARVYLERTNASTETVNRATEIRLLAERQMGEFLKEMPKSHGGATYHPASSPRAPQTDSNESRLTTYKDIGVTRTQAYRSQKLAEIPADEFRERVAVAKASGGKLSTAKIIEQTRRPTAQFSMRSWQTQAQMVIRTWMKSVPESYRAAAIEFLTEVVSSIKHEHP